MAEAQYGHMAGLYLTHRKGAVPPPVRAGSDGGQGTKLKLALLLRNVSDAPHSSTAEVPA